MLCMKLRDQCLDRQYVHVIDVISHFGYVSKLNVSLLFVVEVFMRRTGGDLAAPASSCSFLSCLYRMLQTPLKEERISLLAICL